MTERLEPGFKDIFSKMALACDHTLASNTAKCWEDNSAERAPALISYKAQPF